jgi:hypothetical protein
MPGGVAEHRDNHREAEEERQGSQNQQHRNDQSPCRHWHRVSRNGPQRRHHGFPGAGMTIEHQRERNHADAQRHHGEQETDAATDDDQPPSLRCMVSFAAAAGFYAVRGRRRPSLGNDRNQSGQTRRQETEVGHVAS